MIFNIAPTNAETARKCFTATPNPHALPGYKKSAILKPKNRRAPYVYEVDIIDNTCIVCTVRHEEAETTEAIIKLCNYTPASIEVERSELFRNCNNYPYRTETNERYLKKYNQIACIVHGAIKAGLLYDTERQEETPEETPAKRYIFRTYTGWTVYDGITSEQIIAAATDEEAKQKAEVIAAGQAFTVNRLWSAEEDAPETIPAPDPGEAANETPKRRQAWRVECRSPRGTWTQYAAETESREESAHIMEEAEARHTLTPDGAPILYRIVQIDKGPADDPNGDTTPETAPTATESTTGEAETATTKTEPQRAAETPKRDTDREQTARDNQSHPKASTSGSPEPVTDSGRTTAAKTTGAAPPGQNTPQETTPTDYRKPQTAPPRHETAEAAQTTTRSNRSPPRARETSQTPRTAQSRINTCYPRFWQKVDQKQNKCFGHTISEPKICENRPSFFGH